LGLGEEDKAIEIAKDIMANQKAHSRIRVMLELLPLLIKKQDGKKALAISNELLKVRVPRKDLVDVRLNHSLALSLTKKYSEAKRGLSSLIDDFGEDYAGLGERVASAETTILVYHEKNYNKAIRFFEDMLKEDRKNATADIYSKLAYCYGQKKKWEESRWNYLQAYLVGSFSSVELKELISKIEMTNSKISSEKGNVALESFFWKS
jgi:tetratricopeptide (TPR) repeat protein